MMGDVKPCVLAIQPDATPNLLGRELPGGRPPSGTVGRDGSPPYSWGVPA
jgi:hypothetical protein